MTISSPLPPQGQWFWDSVQYRLAHWTKETSHNLALDPLVHLFSTNAHEYVRCCHLSILASLTQFIHSKAADDRTKDGRRKTEEWILLDPFTPVVSTRIHDAACGYCGGESVPPRVSECSSTTIHKPDIAPRPFVTIVHHNRALSSVFKQKYIEQPPCVSTYFYSL